MRVSRRVSHVHTVDVEWPAHATADAGSEGRVLFTVAASAALLVGFREPHEVALAVVQSVRAAQSRRANYRAYANVFADFLANIHKYEYFPHSTCHKQSDITLTVESIRNDSLVKAGIKSISLI